MGDDPLARVKQLIRQRRYGEARALLAQLDEATARRWLHRLEEHEQAHSARSDGLTAALIVAGIVLLIGGGLTVARLLGWV